MLEPDIEIAPPKPLVLVLFIAWLLSNKQLVILLLKPVTKIAPPSPPLAVLLIKLQLLMFKTPLERIAPPFPLA